VSGRRRSVWRLPALLGLVSIVGLLAALLFDRWGDRVSWIALAVIAALSLWTCVKGLAPARDPGRPDRPR
jgi:zinc transporter ZupT